MQPFMLVEPGTQIVGVLFVDCVMSSTSLLGLLRARSISSSHTLIGNTKLLAHNSAQHFLLISNMTLCA